MSAPAGATTPGSPGPAPGRPATAWLLVVLKAHAIANAVGSDKKRSALLALGIAVIVGYFLLTLREVARSHSGAVLAQPASTQWSGLAIAAVLGVATGVVVARLVTRDANSPWLVSLPISLAGRLRAASVLGALIGVTAGSAVGGLGALAADWLGLPAPLLAGAMLATTYLGGYALAFAFALLAGARQAARARMPGGPATRPAVAGKQTARGRLLMLLDRPRPRWLGHWVVSGQGLPTLLLGLAAFANLLGIGGSIAQHTAFPALLMAVITAHAGFLLRLRMHPLASPVLRASAVPFGAALWGTVRLPLYQSTGSILPLIVVAFAVDPAHVGRSAGYVVGILYLALQYALTLASAPEARGMAVLMHCVVLAIAAQESILYQYIVLLALAAYDTLLWYRARRRYCVYG